jgi:hypothetical protein
MNGLSGQAVGRMGWARLLVCLAALGAGCWVVSGQSAGEGAESGGTGSEGGSGWERFLSVRLVGGVKDNVLLASEGAESSSFVGAGVEAMVWCPLGPDGELEVYGLGEHRRYLSTDLVESEETVIVGGRYRRELGLEWTLEMPLDYLYIDEVMDVSATEAVPTPTRIRGHTVGIRPAVQHHWVSGTGEVGLSGVRQWYELPLDDTWETGVRLAWRPGWGPSQDLELFYGFGWVRYDEELDPVEGTRRQMQRHDVGGRWRQFFGAGDAWRLTGRVGVRYAADLQSGYYDYVRPSAGLGLTYRVGRWEFGVEGRGLHYAYLTQRVGDGGGEHRRRSEIRGEVRAERELASWAKLVVEYLYEETFANRPSEAYSVHTLSGGVELVF